ILFLDKGAQQLLSSVKGTVRFEVTGYNGRTWALMVTFGMGGAGGSDGTGGAAATQADATISVDAETYAAILARTLAPPQAFFSGKVKLTGDASLAMQLGMAMMPRFQ